MDVHRAPAVSAASTSHRKSPARTRSPYTAPAAASTPGPAEPRTRRLRQRIPSSTAPAISSRPSDACTASRRPTRFKTVTSSPSPAPTTIPSVTLRRRHPSRHQSPPATPSSLSLNRCEAVIRSQDEDVRLRLGCQRLSGLKLRPGAVAARAALRSKGSVVQGEQSVGET